MGYAESVTLEMELDPGESDTVTHQFEGSGTVTEVKIRAFEGEQLYVSRNMMLSHDTSGTEELVSNFKGNAETLSFNPHIDYDNGDELIYIAENEGTDPSLPPVTVTAHITIDPDGSFVDRLGSALGGVF